MGDISETVNIASTSSPVLKAEVKDLLQQSLELLGRAHLDIEQWEQCAQVEMREQLDEGGSDDGIWASACLRQEIRAYCEDLKRILGITDEYTKAAEVKAANAQKLRQPQPDRG